MAGSYTKRRFVPRANSWAFCRMNDLNHSVFQPSIGKTRVRIAPKFKPIWTQKRRYKGMRGGRASGKSHHVADRLVTMATIEHVRSACMREVQNSIRDSSKRLIEDKIRDAGLDSLFKITDREIVCPHTESLFVFRGLQNHTASSIKSLEGFNYAWYEEAQNFTQRSLDLALPTFRSDSEQLFTWNTTDESDPVDKHFLSNLNDPDFLFIQANYWDNPWLPPELKGDILRDYRRDRDKYDHVWGGKHRRNSSARVFKNIKSFHFDTPSDAMFQHGADWGFAEDPTTLVRCFTGDLIDGNAIYNPDGRTLFIDYEVYALHCEIVNTPKLFDGLVPDAPQIARKWQIRADSARPETISHMQNHGYPLMVRSTKGPNSIVEGIKFLQDYDIVVHPRCRHTWDEFNWYSYRVDKKTEQITNDLEDKKNHVIDAVRYAVELLRRPEPEWYVSK